MSTLARLAVGTVQSGMDRRPMVWALMDALHRREVQVQGFASRACLCEHQPIASITGLKHRYLDSWLMDEVMCREIFVHGSRLADLSIVEGAFQSKDANADAPGGRLETLCEWLRLPRIVLLDASRITGGLPCRPARVDGVLLDAVVDQRQLARLTTDIQTVWRAPVLGSLPAGDEFRRRIDRLSPGEQPPPELLEELGEHLARSWDAELLLQLAQTQPLGPVNGKLFRSEHSSLRLTVAVAFDKAFGHYFPCTLDMLEARGATVVDFSPLHDEHLPPDSDIVLLGGGHPERFGWTLAENHCMKTALRNHARWGRRIYAEGGGLALLCQAMIAPNGETTRMAGLLPAVASAAEPSSEPTPVEATLARANWLGYAGIQIRGYRNPRWNLEPLGHVTGFLADDSRRFDMLGTFQTVGSMIEVHFGVQSNLLNHFFYPHKPTPPDVDPWSPG